MARQILLHHTGPADVLKIESVPDPELKANEVTVAGKFVAAFVTYASAR
jgi:NADPH:quinone reductase-like Zn-dependent oxidoreductase